VASAARAAARDPARRRRRLRDRQWGHCPDQPRRHDLGSAGGPSRARRELGTDVAPGDDEEACATVVAARLLGFTRGRCITGPERGRVLVRSIWRADVELRPWEARFEIADRRVVTPAAVGDVLSLGSHPFAAIIRRELQEAARSD
jgi:hypothetical protein